MIVWKFAIYLGVMTLLFALIVSVVAIARYGRGDSSGSADKRISHHDEMPGSFSG